MRHSSYNSGLFHNAWGLEGWGLEWSKALSTHVSGGWCWREAEGPSPLFSWLGLHCRRWQASKGKHLEECPMETTTLLEPSLGSQRASLPPFYPGWSSPKLHLPQIHQEETQRPHLSGKSEDCIVRTGSRWHIWIHTAVEKHNPRQGHGQITTVIIPHYTENHPTDILMNLDISVIPTMWDKKTESILKLSWFDHLKTELSEVSSCSRIF